MDIRTKGLNHLCFPTYYRGPFVASNIANLPLDLRSILAMIVPVVVGPLAGHANSLSAPLQRPIRSVQISRIYDAPSLPRKDNRFDQELNRTQELPLGSASPVLGVMRGDVRGRLATTEALSYILQRPIRSVKILRIYPSISGNSHHGYTDKGIEP